MPPTDRVGVHGRLRCFIEIPDVDAAIVEGFDYDPEWHKSDSGLWYTVVERNNAFLNQGLQAILRRYFNITTVPAVPSGIGVSSDNTAVTATSTTFGGTFRYSAWNATFPSITNQTVSGQSSFTKGAGAGQIDFSVRKIGITNATTDAVGAVQDIIGGAGVSPYNEAITIDLTSATSFTLSPQIDVTLTAV